jgi:hypothetical protein
LLSNIDSFVKNLIDYNITITTKMHCTACIRKAPNQGPTSLAATTTLLSENEAINAIKTLVSNTNIDPALTNHDIDPPPP